MLGVASRGESTHGRNQTRLADDEREGLSKTATVTKPGVSDSSSRFRREWPSGGLARVPYRVLEQRTGRVRRFNYLDSVAGAPSVDQSRVLRRRRVGGHLSFSVVDNGVAYGRW